MITVFVCMQLVVITECIKWSIIWCYARASVTWRLILCFTCAVLSHFCPILVSSPHLETIGLKKTTLYQLPIPPVSRAPIPGLFPFSLILCAVPRVSLLLLLLLFSISALVASFSALPGHPAGTCNLQIRAADLGLCPEVAFLSKHSSRSYEQMKRFNATQVKHGILKITSDDYYPSGRNSPIRNNKKKKRGHLALATFGFAKARMMCTEDQREKPCWTT